MNIFMKNFKSEIYKINHSILMWIHIIIPIMVAGVFLLYYNYSTWNEFTKVSVYIQVLALSFPFLIGLITVISAEQEEGAGSFAVLLSSQSKNMTHLSKLVVLLLYGLFATIFAVVGFGELYRVQGNILFDTTIYFKVSIIIFLCTVPLYLIHYLIAYNAGKSAGIISGIVGSLISALLLTGLGDGLWHIIPWGILIRLSSIFLYLQSMNAEIFSYPNAIKAVINLAIISLLLIVITIIWSKKWEGRASIDDK